MNAYRVFISSTYLDNATRRRDVLEAIARAGRMMAVCMERFTADDRPTLEVCRSRAAECDLFVGITAHRYGWEPEGQTPGEEKSITRLEYEAARAAGRPCLMFEIERAAPFTLADMDPEPGTYEKGRKLARFKELYAKEQLLAAFNDGNLGMVVQQALVEWRERWEGKQTPEPTLARAASLEEEIRRYGEAAVREHGTLQLSGFEAKLRVPIDLEELYVPLWAWSDLRGRGEAAFADARHAREVLERDGPVQEVSLLEAFGLAAQLKRRGLVILGEPGAGKTTHLSRLLLYCLKEGPEKLGLPEGMVPVLLPLRALEDPEREALDHVIARHLDEQLGLPRDFGQRLVERGNLLLLFDGLDEVANLEQREKVARWIERVLRAHSSCWPVVTCRFAGYGEQGLGRSEVRLSPAFLELTIQPLKGAQTEEFVRKWYRLVESGLDPDRQAAARRAEKKSGELIAQLKTGDLRTARVAEMVGNPLLLASLCLVHRDHGRLPEDRRRLYDESVDVLLERWRARQGPLQKLKVEQAKRALQPVAEWLHQKEGRTKADSAELEPVLGPALRAVRWEAGGTREFLGTVRDESGLLTGWGPGHFGFMHLGFQEYLVASELRRRAAEAGERQRAVLEELARHYGESWWQEVLLLFVAMGNPSMFGPLMREVVKQPAFAERRDLLGMLLEEAAEREPDPFVELVRQPADQDSHLWRRQRQALEALRLMGETEELAKLVPMLRNHPSLEIQEWLETAIPAIGVEVTQNGGVELVRIPGGEFMMGSPADEPGRHADEGPQHRVKVSPFWLGRYPVTNEQYERFLKANPGVRAPSRWGDRRFNQAQQPVVGVTWFEAKAFADWAGGRLPTEAEWELACRAGVTAARYEQDLGAISWHGNNSGSGPHPVSEKKANAWGLHDILGNVWEWCSDWRGHYPKGGALVSEPAGPGMGTHRIIRGGSWRSNVALVRAAYRLSFEPSRDDDSVGLRLARSLDGPADGLA